MRYIYFLSLLLVSTFLNAKMEIPAPELNIGYVEFHPYLFKNKEGEYIGPVVDYVKKLVPKSVSIKYVETPISRVRYSLNTGIIDIFPMYFYSEERATHLHFVQPPYHKFDPQLCSFDKDLKIEKEYLKDKTLVHVRGTLKNSAPLKIEEVKKIEIAPNEFTKVAFKLLELRRADLIYFPDNFAFQQTENKKVYCKSVPSSGDALHFVLKNGSEWIQFIEKQIAKNANGFTIK